MVCPDHKEQRATRFIVKFNKVWKRFKTYERSHRFLAGLHFKTDEGTFELGYRQTISKDEQEAILEEVKKISWQINPKVWIAIKFLCTYISIGPGELITLKEGDIDYGNRYLFFPHPKEKKHKLVPILDEDVELLKSFPRGMYPFPCPALLSPREGHFWHRRGQSFLERYLWKWWNKACTNLGITGVDLYGGTRHSSAKALRHFCSPEEIKRATMHSTNKAFERYFNIESEDLRSIYGKTRGATKVQPKSSTPRDSNILIF